MESKLTEDEPKDLLSGDDFIFDTEEYDKKVKKARNWLFAVAVLQLIFGAVDVGQSPEELRGIVMGIHLSVVAIFTGLAFWSNKKPYAHCSPLLLPI